MTINETLEEFRNKWEGANADFGGFSLGTKTIKAMIEDIKGILTSQAESFREKIEELEKAFSGQPDTVLKILKDSLPQRSNTT